MGDRELLLSDDTEKQDESLALTALDALRNNIGLKSVKFDESQQVTSYSTSSLFFLGFISPRHSVWNIPILFRIVLMCALATLFGHLSCIGPKAVNAEWDFCFPVLSSADGLVFSSLVSFLLGMFQTLTFNRWCCPLRLSVFNMIALCTFSKRQQLLVSFQTHQMMIGIRQMGQRVKMEKLGGLKWEMITKNINEVQ